MTEQFFEKELAARKIEAIPGLIEFDVCLWRQLWLVQGKLPKEKMLPLGFPGRLLCGKAVAK